MNLSSRRCHACSARLTQQTRAEQRLSPVPCPWRCCCLSPGLVPLGFRTGPARIPCWKPLPLVRSAVFSLSHPSLAPAQRLPCSACSDDYFMAQVSISRCSAPPGAGCAPGRVRLGGVPGAEPAPCSSHPRPESRRDLSPPPRVRDAGTALGSIPRLLPPISVLCSHQGPPAAPLPGSLGDPSCLLRPCCFPGHRRGTPAPKARAAPLRLGIPAPEQTPASEPEQRLGPVAAGHSCCRSVPFMLN